MNLAGQPITSSFLQKWLNDEKEIIMKQGALRAVLRHLGFKWGRGKRSNIQAKASTAIQKWRYLYCSAYIKNKLSPSPLQNVWLDETYLNKNHTTEYTWYGIETGGRTGAPSGKGARWIIVNAGASNGWISGAELIFRGNNKNEDYHGNMNAETFEKWFAEKLLPNLKSPSLIHLDNAAYHRKGTKDFNLSKARKGEIQAYLTKKNVVWEKNWTVPKLKEAAKKFIKNVIPPVEILAKEKGHSILWLPPYHPEFNPIEYLWGIAKNEVGKRANFSSEGIRDMEKVRDDLRDGFALGTPEVWKKTVEKCEEVITSYWTNDLVEGLSLEEVIHIFQNEEGTTDNIDGVNESMDSDEE
jgi:transposase